MIMPFDVNGAKSRGRRSAACLRSDPDTELSFTIFKRPFCKTTQEPRKSAPAFFSIASSGRSHKRKIKVAITTPINAPKDLAIQSVVSVRLSGLWRAWL